MLVQEDLQGPWQLQDSPVTESTGRALEATVRPNFTNEEWASVSWDSIRNEETNERVTLRLSKDAQGLPVVSAVLYSNGAESVTPAHVSRLPVQAIEAAARSRVWESKFLVSQALASGGNSPLGPLGTNDGSDEFYRRVAAQYLVLSRESSKPTTEMAKTSKVPLRTAQRWVTEARKRGALPPGRKGRAG